MRHALVAVLLALSVALTGCFQLDQVVVVKPDGSGAVEVTSCMSEEVIKMMSGFSKMGKEEGAKEEAAEEPDMFKEDELKAKAAEMGEGVEYVSMEKVKKDGFAGVKAIYKFKDVSKLKLESKPSNKNGGEAPAEDPLMFRFAPAAGGNALLTVVMPKNEAKPKTEPTGEAPKAEKEPTAEEMAQMKKMLKGFRFGTAVRVEGAVVKTNSAFVDGPTVTLFEVDFGALLENADKLKELKMKDPQSLAEVGELMKGIPGFKINLAPEITIEFAGK